MDAIPTKWILYGVGAGVALLILNKLAGGRLVAGAASAVVQVPVDVFYGVTDGVFGLPDTRVPATVDACTAAKESGDCWEASFQCPALDYMACLRDKYL